MYIYIYNTQVIKYFRDDNIILVLVCVWGICGVKGKERTKKERPRDREQVETRRHGDDDRDTSGVCPRVGMNIK